MSRQDDFLGDNGSRRQGHSHIAGCRAQTLPGSAHGFRHPFQVGDIAVRHRIPGQGFDCVTFDPIGTLAVVYQLNHLDRGRADIQSQQGARFRVEDREINLQWKSLFKLANYKAM